MTQIPILTAYRPSDPSREAAWERTKAQIDKACDRYGYKHYVADSGHQPFSLAATNNLLARMAGDWEVAISWNADLLLDSIVQVDRAVTLCKYFVFAHSAMTYQMEHDTRLIKRRRHNTTWGVTVFTRECWDVVGGFDEGFQGWGGEDNAFVKGVEINFGKLLCVRGHCYALWHDRPEKVENPAWDVRWWKETSDEYWESQIPNNKRLAEIYTPIKTREEWAQMLKERTRVGS